LADGTKEWWLDGEEVDEATVRKADSLERLGKVEFEPLARVTF
jgi:hypothetical protein